MANLIVLKAQLAQGFNNHQDNEEKFYEIVSKREEIESKAKKYTEDAAKLERMQQTHKGLFSQHEQVADDLVESLNNKSNAYTNIAQKLSSEEDNLIHQSDFESFFSKCSEILGEYNKLSETDSTLNERLDGVFASVRQAEREHDIRIEKKFKKTRNSLFALTLVVFVLIIAFCALLVVFYEDIGSSATSLILGLGIPFILTPLILSLFIIRLFCIYKKC